MNKKILAILMALLMVLTSVAALAQVSDANGDETQLNKLPDSDVTAITVKKNHTGAGKPAETFTFDLYTDDACQTELAGFDAVTIEIGANVENGTVSLPLPIAATAENLGEHVYFVKETKGNYAGVTYSENVYKLTVTVYATYDTNGNTVYRRVASIRNVNSLGTKVTEAAFENSYTAYNLDVTKKFSGNSADTRDTFTFKVTITAPTNTILANTITVTPTDGTNGTEKLTVGTPTTTTNDDGTITAYTYVITGVGKDDTIKFANLPVNCTYTVEETNNVGTQSTKTYNCSNPNGTGTITADTTVDVTNSLDLDIDTGVDTDNMPYIMLMAFVMMLAAAVVLKKRTVND